MHGNTLINLTRDVEAIAVPDGDRVTLPKAQLVRILQELGESYTVMNPIGARFRIEGKDADALGRNPPAKKEDGPEGHVELTKEGVEKAVWDQLRKVYDPEIPFNIVDVGLIYECVVDETKPQIFSVFIRMTLTAPGCGIGDVLVNDVYVRVGEVPGVERVDVEMTFDPAWDFSRLSEAARMQLNL